jgi:hypothetical protein
VGLRKSREYRLCTFAIKGWRSPIYYFLWSSENEQKDGNVFPVISVTCNRYIDIRTDGVLYQFLYSLSMLLVGPCHHGMARPRVADGGTASNMEGSCEYIE